MIPLDELKRMLELEPAQPYSIDGVLPEWARPWHAAIRNAARPLLTELIAAREAIEKMPEQYANAIRLACQCCNGTGVGGVDGRGDSIECEYCGRPMRTILDFAAAEKVNGERNF